MRHMPPNSTVLCDIQVFPSPPHKDVAIKPVLQITPDEEVEEAPAIVWNGMSLLPSLQHIWLLWSSLDYILLI